MPLVAERGEKTRPARAQYDGKLAEPALERAGPFCCHTHACTANVRTSAATPEAGLHQSLHWSLPGQPVELSQLLQMWALRFFTPLSPHKVAVLLRLCYHRRASFTPIQLTRSSASRRSPRLVQLSMGGSAASAICRAPLGDRAVKAPSRRMCSMAACRWRSGPLQTQSAMQREGYPFCPACGWPARRWCSAVWCGVGACGCTCCVAMGVCRCHGTRSSTAGPCCRAGDGGAASAEEGTTGGSSVEARAPLSRRRQQGLHCCCHVLCAALASAVSNRRRNALFKSCTGATCMLPGKANATIVPTTDVQREP